MSWTKQVFITLRVNFNILKMWKKFIFVSIAVWSLDLLHRTLLSNSNNLSLKIALRLPPLHLSGFGSGYSAKVKNFKNVSENTFFAHTNRNF